MLQPPQAAQKLRTWLRVSFGLALQTVPEFGGCSRESEHVSGVAIQNFFSVPGFQIGMADVLDGVIEKLSASYTENPCRGK